MTDLLWYILSNFWPFVGFVVVICVMAQAFVAISEAYMMGIADIVSAWRFPRQK